MCLDFFLVPIIAGKMGILEDCTKFVAFRIGHHVPLSDLFGYVLNYRRTQILEALYAVVATANSHIVVEAILGYFFLRHLLEIHRPTIG